MLKIMESNGTGNKEVKLENGMVIERTASTYRKKLSTFNCDTGETVSAYEIDNTVYGIVSIPENGFYKEVGCIIL